MTTQSDLDLRARSLAIILEHQAASGAFVAGPTFSQYGYAWFRDGAFIAEALDLVGELEAAARFHRWTSSVIHAALPGMRRAATAARAGRAPDPADLLHCRYTVDGREGPDDWPTFQLDGPGIWLWSLAHHVRLGGTATDAALEAAAHTARYLAALRDVPSHDAWEETPEVVHTSTVAATIAGLQAAAELGVLERDDAQACAELERRIAAPAGGTLTKWPGNDAVDASLLWVVRPYGLLEPDHPVAASTVRRIEAELVDADGGVHRYLDDVYYGGGAWLLLTAGLARVRLARRRPGDLDRARAAARWIEAQATADGSLPEQVTSRAFHPDHIDTWRVRWGEPACPLLWSHATYLALRSELDDG